ncbi:hypothetical protein [Gallaecimonas pentaromativorans]|uniref:hypothetical protein n=1 Tax=Gallaecimonas pentaromativorans TaxID=584787 RepID=UPI003A955B25
MYGIPKKLNLDVVTGSECTQIRVGQFDIQFTFGEVNFAVQSKIILFKNEVEVGFWEEGKWPDSVFYEIMNVPVESVRIHGARTIVITLEDGLSIHLCDSSEQFETLKISIGENDPWII